jgi:hypothetical protein
MFYECSNRHLRDEQWLVQVRVLLVFHYPADSLLDVVCSSGMQGPHTPTGTAYTAIHPPRMAVHSIMGRPSSRTAAAKQSNRN